MKGKLRYYHNGMTGQELQDEIPKFLSSWRGALLYRNSLHNISPPKSITFVFHGLPSHTCSDRVTTSVALLEGTSPTAIFSAWTLSDSWYWCGMGISFALSPSFHNLVCSILWLRGATSATVSSGSRDWVNRKKRLRYLCLIVSFASHAPTPIPIKATIPGPIRETSLSLTCTEAPVTRCRTARIPLSLVKN